jgi:hypothetical protein
VFSAQNHSEIFQWPVLVLLSVDLLSAGFTPALLDVQQIATNPFRCATNYTLLDVLQTLVLRTAPHGIAATGWMCLSLCGLGRLSW